MRDERIKIRLKNGMQIESVEMFRQYFNFEDIYSLVKQDGLLYEGFVRTVFPTYISCMLFGINGPDGKRSRVSAVDLVKEPEQCTAYYPSYFQKMPGKEKIKLQWEPLLDYVGKLYEAAAFDYKRAFPSADWPGTGQFREGLGRLRERLEKDKRDAFTAERAAVLYLYLLLHVQAGRLPDEERSYKGLAAVFDQTGPADPGLETTLVLGSHEEASYCLGELYTKGDGDGVLELVRIVNHGSAPVEVSISGSVLKRKVMPQDTLYALRKCRKYVSFLPRISISEDVAFCLEEGKLLMKWQGEARRVETDFRVPACWAHSSECGTLIVDGEGRLDENCAWLGERLTQPVRSVSAAGLDYCLLLEDGSVRSAAQKKGWQHVIYAVVGLNAGIALDQSRRPILQDGRLLLYEDIVEAFAENSHYICLSSSGNVYTDRGLKTPMPVRAAALCEKGYLLAGEASVILFSYQNERLKEWKGIKTTELAACGRTVWYRDWDSGKDGELCL